MVAIAVSRYLTNENRRLSKPLKAYTQVSFSDLFNKFFLTCNNYSLGGINCVRWNPSGDMLASASSDKTAKVLDFKTGKVLYTGTTSDGSKLLTFHIHPLPLITRRCLFSMFHIDNDDFQRTQEKRIM